MIVLSGYTSSVISGMKGPENESLATVVKIVGTPNSFEARARTWTLSKIVLRSWL